MTNEVEEEGGREEERRREGGRTKRVMVEDTIPWEEVFVSLAFPLFLFRLPVYHSLYVTDRRKEKNGDFFCPLACIRMTCMRQVVLRASVVR